MNPPEQDAETSRSTLANPQAGGFDQPYTWGRPPTTYLTYRQVVRLTILRSKLEGVRAARLGA